jgi:hypothetical protein
VRSKSDERGVAVRELCLSLSRYPEQRSGDSRVQAVKCRAVGRWHATALVVALDRPESIFTCRLAVAAADGACLRVSMVSRLLLAGRCWTDGGSPRGARTAHPVFAAFSTPLDWVLMAWRAFGKRLH